MRLSIANKRDGTNYFPKGIMFYVKYSSDSRLFFGKKISLYDPDVQQLLFSTKCYDEEPMESLGAALIAEQIS